jgi:hypothetical protein
MASQVELQTTQSVSHAAGTPQPTLGRQLRIDHVLLFFIGARPSRLGCDP